MHKKGLLLCFVYNYPKLIGMSLLAKHGSDLLGLGIVGVVGYGLWSEYQKSQPSTGVKSASGLPSPTSAAAVPESKYSAKQYLNELKSVGDESAVKALQAPKPISQDFFPASTVEPFKPEALRFNLTHEGLVHSLENILEGKKKHEQNVLNTFKRNGYPRDYEETLRGLRTDREEVQNLLKGLKKRSQGKGWFSGWF